MLDPPRRGASGPSRGRLLMGTARWARALQRCPIFALSPVHPGGSETPLRRGSGAALGTLFS
eukprot:2350650-Alexandrium_andersonii.AAC.1